MWKFCLTLYLFFITLGITSDAFGVSPPEVSSQGLLLVEFIRPYKKLRINVGQPFARQFPYPLFNFPPLLLYYLLRRAKVESHPVMLWAITVLVLRSAT